MIDEIAPNIPPLPPTPDDAATASNSGNAWQAPLNQANHQARPGVGLGGQRRAPAPPPRRTLAPGAGAGRVGQRPVVTDWKLLAMQRLGLQSKLPAQTQILAGVTATKGQLFAGPVDAATTRLAGAKPPNTDFAALAGLLTALQAAQQKTPQMRQQAAAGARAFLDSTRTVKMMERNVDSGRANVAKQVLNDLHRMEICEQIEDFGPPPWDSAIAMQVASLKATLDFESLPIGAQMASMNDATSKNPTMWIKGTDAAGGKQKTFIFKPQQEDMGDSQETIREAVAARAADLLNGALNFTIPMPETHIVSIEPERMPPEAKDVIARVAKQKQGALTGSLQTFSAAQGDVKALTRNQAAAIPVQSVHQIAVLDIVTLNTDRHGGNLLTTGNPPTLVPIDHGLAFTSSPNELREKMGGGQNALLKLPASHVEFDDAMKQSIAKLDADAMVTALKQEAALIAQAHPSTAGTLDDDAMNASKVAIEFLKLAADTLTPAEVQVALGRNQSQLFKQGLSKADFKTAAEDAIAAARADREGIAEYFQLPPDQREMVMHKVRQNGWTEEANEFGGSFTGAFNGNLTGLMAIYHANLRKPAAPAAVPNAPPPTNAAAILAQIGQLFPATKTDTPENQAKAFAAWDQFQRMGGDKAALEAAAIQAGEDGSMFRMQKENLITFVRTASPVAAIQQATAQIPPPTIQSKITLRLDYLDSLLPMTPQPVDPDLALTSSDTRALLAQSARSQMPVSVRRLDDYLMRVGGAINLALEAAAARIGRMVTAAEALPNPITALEVINYREGSQGGKIKPCYDALVQHEPSLANVM